MKKKPVAAIFAACVLCTGCGLLYSWEPDPYEIPPGMKRIQAMNRGFDMGSMSGDDDERPVRRAGFTYDFCIDSTEVTQAKYEEMMGLNPSWNFAGSPEELPVEMVTWFDAVLYCNALSNARGLDTMYSYAGIEGTPGSNCTNLEGLTCDMSKKGFRLATEEEWEYACRGSETGDYYWGASAGGPDGWYQGNSGGTSRTIASVRPNSFGLYDMAGNVWEWCNDWYGGYNPDERIDITGPSEGREKVLRGGGFQSAEGAMRSSNRFSSLPLYRSRDLGFRTVYRNWAVE